MRIMVRGFQWNNAREIMKQLVMTNMPKKIIRIFLSSQEIAKIQQMMVTKMLKRIVSKPHCS